VLNLFVEQHLSSALFRKCGCKGTKKCEKRKTNEEKLFVYQHFFVFLAFRVVVSLVCCEALSGFLMQSPIGPVEAFAGVYVKKVCLVGNNG
jgi:hypothetical protein